MDFNPIFRAAGNPFPAGGRVAATVDMNIAGITPTPSANLGDWVGDKARQPTNRGLRGLNGALRMAFA